MHILTKITLGVGALMLVGSIIAVVVGGGAAIGDLEQNPTGTELWNGTSPTTYEGEFSFTGIYYIFAEQGANVTVEFSGGDENSGFFPCEDDQSCEFVEWTGYTYLGTISVVEDGTYEVVFTGDGDVMIREMLIDVGGIMAAMGGLSGVCCSICVLLLGVIFIFTLKEPVQQPGVVMLQPDQVAGQPVVSQPVATQPGVVQQQSQPGVHVGGAVHPAYQQLPPQSGKPPSQGF